MTEPTLYPIKHGDTGRGGVTEGATAATGRVVWSEPTGKESTPYWPADVLIWEGQPLVSTYDALVLFDREGKRRWDRRKDGGVSPAVTTDGLLCYRSHERFIDSVDLEGRPRLKAAPFPGATSNVVTVKSFWPRPKDFIAVLHRRPGDDKRLRPGDSDDLPLPSGRVIVLRNDYPTPYGDWSVDFDAKQALDALLVPGHAIVALALGHDIVRVAPEQPDETELSRFASPVAEMVEWSVDAGEIYTMTGYGEKPGGDRGEGHEGERGPKLLVAFTAEGKTLWRWTEDEESDAWAAPQPPIRLKDDRVCVLTEGRVLVVKGGELVWSFDLRSDMLRHGSPIDDGSFEIKDGKLLAKATARHGTGLADGSLLVTAGKWLFHLGHDGKKLFSVALNADILSTPVVDAEGSVYATTATHLFKIQ
jgi:hypothetical protein